MAILNLIDQLSASNEIKPKLAQMKNLMDTRKNLWSKLPTKQKKKWITSEKDPVMNIAWNVYKYLDANFFGDDIRDEI